MKTTAASLFVVHHVLHCLFKQVQSSSRGDREAETLGKLPRAAANDCCWPSVQQQELESGESGEIIMKLKGQGTYLTTAVLSITESNPPISSGTAGV